MKTINGNNKLERQINKAEKYVGVKLEHASNKYLRITDFDKENTFIIFKDKSVKNVKVVKDGELLVISPINLKSDKPVFVKSFATIDSRIGNGEAFDEFVIFKIGNDDQRAEFKELAKGYDDIGMLNDYINSIKTKELLVEKN